jgi:hypothetical protein
MKSPNVSYYLAKKTKLQATDIIRYFNENNWSFVSHFFFQSLISIYSS